VRAGARRCRRPAYQRATHHREVGVRGRPLADGGVDLGHARHTAVVARPAGVGSEVVAADGLHQAAEDAVAVAGHQHAGTAGAGIGVSGRDAWQRTAGGVAHGAEGVVFGQQPPGAQRVATVGGLDLDAVGIEIGQRLAGKGAGDQLAQFQHLQAVQRVEGDGHGGICLQRVPRSRHEDSWP